MKFILQNIKNIKQRSLRQVSSKNINNVCIFGFGLGGLPLGLSKNDNIKQIDCVDINIHMFELFKTINVIVRSNYTIIQLHSGYILSSLF